MSKSKVYKGLLKPFMTDSKDWTWAFYKPRFYCEWTSFQPHELAFVDLYQELLIPKESVYQAVRFFVAPSLYKPTLRVDIPLGLPVNNKLNDIYSKQLLDDSYRDLIINKLEIHTSSFKNNYPEAPIMGLLGNKTVRYPIIDGISSSDSLSIDFKKDGSPQSLYDIASCCLQSHDHLYMPVVNGKEPPAASLTDLVRLTPEYMKMAPFEPAQAHFQLVSFEDVVSKGADLTPTEIANNGRILQGTCWLAMAIMFGAFLMFMKYFAISLVSIFVQELNVLNYLMVALSTGTLFLFSLYIYFHYMHLFFIFKRNRFSSFYDYYSYCVQNPLAVLPLDNSIERMNDGEFANEIVF